MATLGVEIIDTLKPRARDLLRDAARKLAHLRYADLRVEVVEARFAAAENGAARAMEPLGKKRGRKEYKRGILAFRDGGWEVRTTGPQGSGILSSMVAGNCLIVLEEERGDVTAGETVAVEPF